MKKIYPVLILIITLVLIFYRFNLIPKNLDIDEVEFAKLALSLDKKPYSPYSSLATGHSTLYFYLILFSFKIFGVSNFSLRFPSAFFGLLSPLIFYLISEEIFKLLKIKNYSFFPFVASLILTNSRWYFNFARFSYEVTFLLFLELVSIYFFLKWHITQKNFFLILTGVFTGLAFNSYTPGRIFFFLPLSFLIFRSVNLLTRKQQINIIIKQLLYFSIPFIIVIFPLSFYLLKNKDIRFEQQFFLSNSDLSLKQKVSFLFQNFKSSFLMFFLKGDLNGRHNYPGKPALNLVLNLFFLLGLYYGIRNIKKSFFSFALIYLLLSILPTIFTYPWENPNMLRTFTVIPSVIFFLTLGVYQIITIIEKKTKTKISWYLVFFLIVLSSIYEVRTYFKYQSKIFEKAFEIRKSLEKIMKIK